MTRPDSPALHAFLEQLGDAGTLAQVAIQKNGARYELRHVSDQSRPASELKSLAIPELRTLAQTTEEGRFRPLKSAPNLARGWRAVAENASELDAALERLYPGALADALAARQSPPPLTNFREFVQRQSGMYRVTALLTDAQAARVIASCCPPQFCLKRRLWSAALAAPDPPEAKSTIPCLEPCALLLEWARLAARLEQEEKHELGLSASEWETIASALQRAQASGAGPDEREADFASARNPRRVQWVLDKLAALKAAGDEGSG
jgi:hypothetical protein